MAIYCFRCFFAGYAHEHSAQRLTGTNLRFVSCSTSKHHNLTDNFDVVNQLQIKLFFIHNRPFSHMDADR